MYIKICLFLRLTLWKRKTDGTKLSSKPPELKSLPPTTEALELNILRAHYQAMMWNNSITGSPPDKDPCLVSFSFNAIYPNKPLKTLLTAFGLT